MIKKQRISFPRLKFREFWKKRSSGVDEKVEIVLRWRNLTMSAVRRCAGNEDLAALFRVGASGALSDVELLAQFTGKNDRSMFMIRGICVAASALVVLGLAAPGLGARGWQDSGQERKTDTSRRASGDSSSHKTRLQPATLEDRYNALAQEFESKNGAYHREYQKLTAKATSMEDHRKAAEQLKNLAPDQLAYGKRFLELAREKPDDPIAADAAYYVHQIVPRVQQLELVAKDRDSKALWREYWEPYVESLTLLREHHAASPKMAEYLQQVALGASPESEALLRAVLAKNPSHEAKGHAVQGLAQTLAVKSMTAQSFLEHPERMTELEARNGDRMIRWALGQDPAALMIEAESLHERVLTEFSDVRIFPAYPDDKRTIARTSQDWLADHRQMVVGTRAPDIDGTDLDGKRIKLSDFRGKVIAVVFWASWCGPCLQEVPHEKELAKRLEGKPFALLGVNCDYTKEKARAVVEKEKITWPNWYDGGGDGQRPIAALYHVQGFPAVYVLDGDGIIRFKDVRGEALDRAVEEILKRQESKDREPASAR
jgi:thiol-disulfide isomerase/thioredoxin